MRRLALTTLAVLTAAPAWAHEGAGASFAAGLGHPFGGADHVLAMLAVGLWAATAGGRRLWAWPAAFVGAMALGAAAGALGAPLPGVEPMIVASIVLLGLAVALAVPAGTVLGAAICAAFALFHGHAHGAEMHGAFAPFAAGFAFATALLHAAGLAIGLGLARVTAPNATRALGAAVALGGVALALT